MNNNKSRMQKPVRPPLRQSNITPTVMMKLVETNELEIVNLVEFNPRVNMIVDFMPGTKNYRRITLQYNTPTNDYRTEVYGRTLVSNGPKKS
jgi:hypothetical protein